MMLLTIDYHQTYYKPAIFFTFTEEFLMEDINNYRFMSCGNVPVNGVDDAAEFRLTIEAMNIMGISAEEQSGNDQAKVLAEKPTC